MKFVNFNTYNEKKSLTSEQMAFLLDCEQHSLSGKEIHVCLITSNFADTDTNRLAVIVPIRYTASTGDVYNFQAFTIDGAEKPLEGEPFSARHFGFYRTIKEAIFEAKACYGASTNEEIKFRKMRYSSSKQCSKDK